MLLRSILYKLALIYELMNGHTHLSHSFIINAFLPETAESSSKFGGLPYPAPPLCVQGRTGTFCQASYGMHKTLVTSPVATYSSLKPFDSHNMHEPCNPLEPYLSREEGGRVRKVSMAVH